MSAGCARLECSRGARRWRCSRSTRGLRLEGAATARRWCCSQNERAPAIALTVVRAALSRQALQALCLERSGAARWPRAPRIDGVRWPFFVSLAREASGKTLATLKMNAFPSLSPSLGAIGRHETCLLAADGQKARSLLAWLRRPRGGRIDHIFEAKTSCCARFRRAVVSQTFRLHL